MTAARSSIDGPDGERGLMPFLLDLLPQEVKNKVAAISIQELAEEIRVDGNHEWISDFYLKYGLASSEIPDA